MKLDSSLYRALGMRQPSLEKVHGRPDGWINGASVRRVSGVRAAVAPHVNEAVAANTRLRKGARQQPRAFRSADAEIDRKFASVTKTVRVYIP